MQIQKFHAAACRCTDAKQTVGWHSKSLNMDFILAIAQGAVPSTGRPDLYLHVFLGAGAGNILAFFERPTKLPMDRDRSIAT